MYNDPIVAEIRRLRDEYARRFGYDLDEICRDLREQQQRSDRRVVRRQAQRPSRSRILAMSEGAEPGGAPESRRPAGS